MTRNEKIYFLIVIVTLLVWIYYRLSNIDERKKSITDDVERKWGKDIQDASREHGISAKRIKAIISVESAGDSNATGGIGEIGLMQLTPGAVSDVLRRFNPGELSRFISPDWISGKPLFTTYGYGELYKNPRLNIFTGTAYLRILKENSTSLDEATRKYNAGSAFNGSQAKQYLERVKEFERSIFP